MKSKTEYSMQIPLQVTEESTPGESLLGFRTHQWRYPRTWRRLRNMLSTAPVGTRVYIERSFRGEYNAKWDFRFVWDGKALLTPREFARKFHP